MGFSTCSLGMTKNLRVISDKKESAASFGKGKGTDSAANPKKRQIHFIRSFVRKQEMIFGQPIISFNRSNSSWYSSIRTGWCSLTYSSSPRPEAFSRSSAFSNRVSDPSSLSQRYRISPVISHGDGCVTNTLFLSVLLMVICVTSIF